MKTMATLTTVAALALMTAPVFAASASGVVKSVDPSHDSIRLTDGSAFTLAEGSEAEDFKPGTKVAITYVKKHGESIASAVKIMK
ncbi:DUF1344 domain-containing protein [Rhizobium sp. PL01]|jgi:Cu/Ag efflux protein CusF|uniref:DUF1344 domain-containing protein n=1 Tax=Rhizobium sp. PL01 TaxID=3085631 RepID=UPI002980D259|nr:DUF1344 domain-containing protein [Rhizobium sp. PL01]MDW5317124.1 DUF1344 domain-containing protein [Rhizobium sp. PL01]